MFLEPKYILFHCLIIVYVCYPLYSPFSLSVAYVCCPVSFYSIGSCLWNKSSPPLGNPPPLGPDRAILAALSERLVVTDHLVLDLN